MPDKISVVLTKYERNLVEEYGCALEDIADQLENHRTNPKSVTIKGEHFWMDILVDGLVQSIKRQEIPNGKTEQAVCRILEKFEEAMSPDDLYTIDF